MRTTNRREGDPSRTMSNKSISRRPRRRSSKGTDFNQRYPDIVKALLCRPRRSSTVKWWHWMKLERYELTLSPHTNLPVTTTTRSSSRMLADLVDYCATNDNSALWGIVGFAVPLK